MITFREVRPGDAAVICRHRRRMFEEAGFAADVLDRMDPFFATWIEAGLIDGRYFGFLVEEGGRVVAGVGLVLLDFPPHPRHPEQAQRGYVLNVFVEPEYRGHGLATELVKRGEEEFRRRGVLYEVLHASEMGRPVYERLGWLHTTEMGKAVG